MMTHRWRLSGRPSPRAPRSFSQTRATSAYRWAVSATAGTVLRPNVGQANIAALRDAYTKMQALSGTDNRSWIYWAEYHGFNRFDCWHHARTGPNDQGFSYDLFLPWHRAYLV